MSERKILATYSIEEKIPSGYIVIYWLKKQITDSGCINGKVSISISGDEISIRGIEIIDEALLLSILNNHSGLPELDDYKDEAKSFVHDAANAKRSEYVSDDMDLTYANKRAEAKQFKDSGYPENDIDLISPFTGEYPYVSSYRHAKNLANGRESADIILQKYAELAVMDSLIEDYRHVGNDAIDNAEDYLEVDTAMYNAVNLIGNING